MRNFLLIVIVIACSCLPPVSAHCSEEEIPLTAVPEIVLQAATAAVQGVTLTEAERSNDGSSVRYEIEGYVNGKEYEILVTPGGKVTAVEEDD